MDQRDDSNSDEGIGVDSSQANYVRREWGPAERARHETEDPMVPSRIGTNMEFPHKNHSPPEPQPESFGTYDDFDMLAGSSSVSDEGAVSIAPTSGSRPQELDEQDIDFDFDEIEDVADHLNFPLPVQRAEVFAGPRNHPSVPLPVTPNTPATDGWTSQVDISPARQGQQISPRRRHSPRKIPMLKFGTPRPPPSEASSGSRATTHSSISTLDQSQRQVAKYPASRLRLSLATKASSPQRPQRLLAGIPTLPVFPANPVLLDEKPVDKWGRPEASQTLCNAALLACCLFPPFWFLLGSGYFDTVLGVVPRRTKLLSLFLGLVTLLAAVAFSIVFCIV